MLYINTSQQPPFKQVDNLNQEQGEKSNVVKNTEKDEHLCAAGGKYLGAATTETVWSFLKKLKIEQLYYPEISILGIYPKETKSLTHKDI